MIRPDDDEDMDPGRSPPGGYRAVAREGRTTNRTVRF
jgi:hypothetical protein